jgi:pimeloyl-ACP methyl ester carboxylesterase
MTADVHMIAETITVDGRRLHIAISDNEGATGPDGPTTPPIWAINVHGYFAGGGMYWRESVRLAETMGWRLVNPSLPGFGGSEPLDRDRVSMPALAAQLVAIADHLNTGPVVVLGHSMGGAVAIQFASNHPGRTLGIIYRDGVGTPAWRKRTGWIPAVWGPIAPDLAAMADLVYSVVLDVPDLFVGRMYSTMRSVLPDAGRNMRSVSQTMPVGNMLMAVDQRHEIAELATRGDIPVLPIWGVSDRITHPATATEFENISGVKVQWVPGGHSWMLGRPQGQSEVLRYLDRGNRFVDAVEIRWRKLRAQSASGVNASDTTPHQPKMRIVS